MVPATSMTCSAGSRPTCAERRLPLHHIHVSLTTIKARLDSVHRVIESLLGQQLDGASFDVVLHMSHEPYLLDEGCGYLTPELEQLLAAHGGRFSVCHVNNTGPYRKILPPLERVYALPFDRFAQTLIATVDDDTLYPPTWLAGLYQAYLRYDCVVGYRGRSMTIADGRLAPYRQWSTSAEPQPSPLTVLTGKDGILYSPLHLHPHVREEQAAIRVAPKADDLWLKAHALLLGVPTFAIHDSLVHEFPTVESLDEDVSLYRAYNRQGGNDRAAQAIDLHLRQRYGRSFADLTDPQALVGLAPVISV
jgi:hypothetical protein